MDRRVSMNPTMLPLLGLMPFPMHARAHAIRLRLLRRLLKRLKLRAIWRTLVKLCACWEGHEKERQQEQNDNLHLCLDYAGTRVFDVPLCLQEIWSWMSAAVNAPPSLHRTCFSALLSGIELSSVII
jgi:hypothetical protein